MTNFQDQIEELAQQFLIKIFKELKLAKIDIDKWYIDHLCYRTSSSENYESMKSNFSLLGDLLIESEVNGRNIATYKLFKPIHFHGRSIELVEVPAPKKGKATLEGFEHIEVVIDISFEELINQYPDIIFNDNALSKKLNPELEIEFSNCAIKFHHQSLEEVIKIEKEISSKINGN